MRRFYLFLLTLLVGAAARAAPGDTTRVVAFSNLHADHYGAYDVSVPFPIGGGPYRKVLMHYILGRYQCPAGSQYCGSWDYTTRVQLLNDSLELGRVITPYATDWPLTRKHDYVFDVTDYEQKMHGPQPLRYFYDGYSWGFTVTIVFDFIEGTPPRNVARLERLWEGAFAFGKTSDPIESHLTPRTVYVPGGPVIDAVVLKTIVTGHGADPADCAEFCSKYYDVVVNNQAAGRTQIWKPTCGLNQVSPQTGTWIYDRAGWCPGEAVMPRYHNLTQWAAPGIGMTVDVNMQPYTAANQANATAAYIWQAQVIQYGPPNFQVDADLLENISPSTNPNYARQNPACAGAVVRVRNGGADTLRALELRYRTSASLPWQVYQWAGALGFMAETDVALPLPASAYPAGGTAAGEFTVAARVPGGQDLNRWNDTLRSVTAPVPSVPDRFVVAFRTNDAQAPGTTYSESSWQLLNAETGAVVAERTQAASNTQFSDTLSLPAGCYVLRVTDLGCDGLSWWANPGMGAGSLQIRRADRRQTLRTLNADFGCETNFRFRAVTALGLAESAPEAAALFIFPNPTQANGTVTLDFSLPQPQDVTVRLRTLDGRLVRTQAFESVSAEAHALSLAGLPRGLYLLECVGTKGARLWRRVGVE